MLPVKQYNTVWSLTMLICLMTINFSWISSRCANPRFAVIIAYNGAKKRIWLWCTNQAGTGQKVIWKGKHLIYERLMLPLKQYTVCCVQCNLYIPNLVYSEILFNPNKLFGPKVFYHLLHTKLPCVFQILYIPNSEHKIQSLEYIIA